MKNVILTSVLILIVSLMIQPMLFANVKDSLVAYWNFDEGEGETASDVSGNGHDGVLLGDPQWTDGKFGSALEFDQDGDEVNVPYHENLNQEEAFTVTVWANVEEGSDGHRAPVSSRDDFPQRGYMFYAVPAPSNTWLFQVGKGQGWDSIQGPEVNHGDWEHIAGVYADDTLKFYVNGDLVGEKDFEISVNTVQVFLIGAGGNERPNHTYLFKGKIDEVMLFNRELDKNEITQVMDDGGDWVLPVELSGKLAMTWGKLKAE